MNVIKYFLLISACIAISACSNNKSNSKIKVSSDYSKSSNFTSLSTFGWYNKKTNNKAKYEIMHERITAEVNDNLSGKGFKSTDTTPDFFVNYSVTTEDKLDIEEHDTYSGYANGWNWNQGYGHGMGYSYGVGYSNVKIERHNEYTTEVYKSGTLIIDIVDAKTDKIIWRGMGKKRLPVNPSADTLDHLVKQSVTSIMKNFPPQ